MPGMNRTVPAAILATAALCLATACSTSNGPAPAVANTASCETAFVAQLRTAEANPNAPSSTRPPACAGIDDATLQKLAEQAMATVFAGMVSSTAFPTVLPS